MQDWDRKVDKKIQRRRSAHSGSRRCGGRMTRGLTAGRGDVTEVAFAISRGNDWRDLRVRIRLRGPLEMNCSLSNESSAQYGSSSLLMRRSYGWSLFGTSSKGASNSNGTYCEYGSRRSRTSSSVHSWAAKNEASRGPNR